MQTIMHEKKMYYLQLCFIVIATFLGQYLFLKSKSLYGYTSPIYFGLEKNVDI